MIEISKLLLEKVVFEVRYLKGYMYLDNSGKILNSIIDKHPTFKNISPDPLVGTALTMHEHSISVIFSFDKIIIDIDYPDGSKFYRELANEIITLIANKLEITTFTRVGNRFFYFLPTNKIEEVKLTIQGEDQDEMEVDVRDQNEMEVDQLHTKRPRDTVPIDPTMNQPRKQ